MLTGCMLTQLVACGSKEEARATAIGDKHSYYGTHLTYCAEGSIITHQYDVPIVAEDGTVTAMGQTTGCPLYMNSETK